MTCLRPLPIGTCIGTCCGNPNQAKMVLKCSETKYHVQPLKESFDRLQWLELQSCACMYFEFVTHAPRSQCDSPDDRFSLMIFPSSDLC